MDQTCLDFFQARSTEPLELVHVKHKYNSLTFSIESAGDTCITLIIKDDLSMMKIDLLSRCSLSGKESITTAIDFARQQLIQTVELEDDSDIYYYISGRLKKISLKELSLLETGYTWYETFGFRNGFDEYRVFWIECIHQPCSVLPFECKTAPDTPIHVMCNHLHSLLKVNCPKVSGNKCTMTEEEFMEISTCLKKTFQWVLQEVEVHYKKKMDMNNYSLSLYFPNETWVHFHGSIGKIIGMQYPDQYRVQCSDGIHEIPIVNVKRLYKVLVKDRHIKATIVDMNEEGYIVDFKSERMVVPFENIKVLGGRKTKRRVWNQSLRSVRNR